MKISIIGTGYVGLVTGACLAEKGHRVTCVDIDTHRVAALNRAEAPIFEAGLEELLRRNVGKTLSATTDLAQAVVDSELTLIAVGTPFNGAEIDLTYVLGAARQIGEALKRKGSYHAVIVKSTVVPGTTLRHVLPALEAASGKKAGQDFGVGMNPEFLSEGEAVNDFLFPDRIVLGGIDGRTLDLLEAVYAPFGDAPRLRTNPGTAEMIKYASNSLLATLISFTNELANLGAALGARPTNRQARFGDGRLQPQAQRRRCQRHRRAEGNLHQGAPVGNAADPILAHRARHHRLQRQAQFGGKCQHIG